MPPHQRLRVPKIRVPVELKILREVCRASQKELISAFKCVDIPGHRNSCWYRDNGADILAVAHMDTVQQGTHFKSIKIGDEEIVYSPRLDDRLGVYTIGFLLPMLGVKCDVLLTEDEETYNSSATGFNTTKDYKWIFSFDRAGSDVVTYQYDDDQFHSALKDAHFYVSTGSYSDICDLDFLEVCGLNVGTGLRDGHGMYANFSMLQYKDQVRKFMAFYREYRNTQFVHVPSPHYRYGCMGGGAHGGNSYLWDEEEEDYGWGSTLNSRPLMDTCPVCGTAISERGICMCSDTEWERKELMDVHMGGGSMDPFHPSLKVGMR